MQYFAGKWYKDADQFPSCSQSPTALFSLERRLDERNLTHSILNSLRWSRSGKGVVIIRGINVAGENQSCVHCTGSSSFTPADSYSHAGAPILIKGCSKAELLCSEGTVWLTLRLEQGGAAELQRGCCPCWHCSWQQGFHCIFSHSQGRNQI